MMYPIPLKSSLRISRATSDPGRNSIKVHIHPKCIFHTEYYLRTQPQNNHSISKTSSNKKSSLSLFPYTIPTYLIDPYRNVHMPWGACKFCGMGCNHWNQKSCASFLHAPLHLHFWSIDLGSFIINHTVNDMSLHFLTWTSRE